MDFIRRAWLFTKAKLSRTILLIVAFSAILIFVLSGLIINSAAKKSIADAKTAAGATVSLSVNMQNVVKKAQASSSTSSSSSSSSSEGKHFGISMPTISEATADKIAKLSGVASYSYIYSASANASTGIEKVSESSTSSSSSNSDNKGFGAGGQGGPGGMSQSDFTITGTNDLANNSAFSDSYKITSGRAITSSDQVTNNVVIESTLASQNDLKVGSTFKLKDDNSKTYTVKVVGIFTTKSSNTENSISYMNNIYSALSLANSMKATTNQISSATYEMTNPAKASQFVTAANKLVNNDEFSVAKDDQAYQNVKSSLNNVANFAQNIVLIVAIAGAIILALIVMLMVRERRYEIGVLMSLGESKIKIIGQFFSELVMTMIVGLVIALAAGNLVGNVVGQQVLKQEQSSQMSSSNNGAPSAPGAPGQNGNSNSNSNSESGNRPSGAPSAPAGGFGGAGRALGFGQSRAQAQALEKLNIKTSASTVFALLGIALLIIIVAVALASAGILRLSPKAVLTN